MCEGWVGRAERSSASVPHDELRELVLRLLPPDLVLFQERGDVTGELELAVPAHPDPAPALRLHPLPIRVLRREEVRVVREDGANVRVRPEAALFFDRGPPARERVPDLFLRDVR